MSSKHTHTCSKIWCSPPMATSTSAKPPAAYQKGMSAPKKVTVSGSASAMLLSRFEPKPSCKVVVIQWTGGARLSFRATACLVWALVVVVRRCASAVESEGIASPYMSALLVLNSTATETWKLETPQLQTSNFKLLIMHELMRSPRKTYHVI